MVARIASIFTALRKYEGAMHMKEYICTDEDFHASMQIVQTILNHSLLVASSLPGRANETSTYAVILPNPVGRRKPP